MEQLTRNTEVVVEEAARYGNRSDLSSMETSIAEVLLSMAQSAPNSLSSLATLNGGTNPGIHLRPPVLSCIPFPRPSSSSSEPIKSNRIVVLPRDYSAASSQPQHGTPLPQPHQQKQRPLSTSTTSSIMESFFPYQSRTTNTPPSSSHNLLQTILQGNQQMKTEFQNFIKQSQSKLKDKDETIKTLRESVVSYQKKHLEMKVENEICSARSSKFLQEVYHDMHCLIQKVEQFFQAESIDIQKNGTAEDPSNSNFEQVKKMGQQEEERVTINSFLENSDFLKVLEEKMGSLEETAQNMLTTCKATQDSLNSYASSTMEKLNNITELLTTVAKRGEETCDQLTFPPSNLDSHTPEEIFPDVPSKGNYENEESRPCFQSQVPLAQEAIQEIGPLGNVQDQDQVANLKLSVFDGEEMSDDDSLMIHFERMNQEENKENTPSKQGDLRSHDINSANMEKRKRISTTHQLKKLVRKRRKLEIMDQRKGQSEEESNDDSHAKIQPPPILSLPSRIVKYSNMRMNSMPILQPQCTPKCPQEILVEGEDKYILPDKCFPSKDKPKVKKYNGVETIQLANNSTEDDEDKDGNEKTFNLIFENEDGNIDVKLSEKEGKELQRRRSFCQVNRDIHGIRKEREDSTAALHSRDFSKLGFACMCGAKFTGAGGLYVHQVKMLEVEKFFCECGKRFHYFSGLKAHRKSSHQMEFTQQVGCSRCGRIFNSKKERQGHVDESGQTCWLSGSYQSKNWEIIRNKRLAVKNLKKSIPFSRIANEKLKAMV